MKRPIVYAVSQDPYWLKAVAKVAVAGIAIEVIECTDGYPDCLKGLPEPQPEALLLLDATGQSDVVYLSRLLSTRGWQHIVVVAADPHSKEARAVLTKGAADDYWSKTYERAFIQRDVSQYITEVWGPDHE